MRDLRIGREGRDLMVIMFDGAGRHRCQVRQANVHNILSHTRGSPRIEVRDR
jgi:hypothetical protein